ncbi:hypothetical protein RRG08_048624 [Elysia crispata]|uniref:Uncharacterized protein n=1 Tax=Elysia crispata TaxID=231223 RepID=A0AAE1DX10_9GAST|nr:hypothetical protein RRG08_048624 [Elysia crispata]
MVNLMAENKRTGLAQAKRRVLILVTELVTERSSMAQAITVHQEQSGLSQLSGKSGLTRRQTARGTQRCTCLVWLDCL